MLLRNVFLIWTSCCLSFQKIQLIENTIAYKRECSWNQVCFIHTFSPPSNVKKDEHSQLKYGSLICWWAGAKLHIVVEIATTVFESGYRYTNGFSAKFYWRDAGFASTGLKVSVNYHPQSHSSNYVTLTLMIWAHNLSPKHKNSGTFHFEDGTTLFTP